MKIKVSRDMLLKSMHIIGMERVLELFESKGEISLKEFFNNRLPSRIILNIDDINPADFDGGFVILDNYEVEYE